MAEPRARSNVDVQDWFATKVPDHWFTGEPLVRFDREEILIVGELACPDGVEIVDPSDDRATADADTAGQVACSMTITQFRDHARDLRMAIADEAEVLWDRKLSWGVRCGGYEILFTTQSVPVMTRLRMDERGVLDTLIAAGVARSRSEALAWCVRLVGTHQAEWIGQLRDTMAEVERVRADGPT